MTDYTIFEVQTSFHEEFDKLCLRTASDYFKLMEEMLPTGTATTVEVVMLLHSAFLSFLVQNIMAALTADIARSFYAGRADSEVVLADLTTAINRFLISKEFRKPLRLLIEEMFNVTDEAKQRMH